MKKSTIHFFCITLSSFIVLLTSCNKEPDHVEFDCGTVETKITELDQYIGAFDADGYSSLGSSDFEEAAIFIEIEMLDLELESDCSSYTPVPQIIETIDITSSEIVTIDGIEYTSGESLIDLFKLTNKNQIYSIPEFINAQANDPLIFYDEGDRLVLQLLDKPDITIDQSFEIQFTFNHSEVLNIVIPHFEVFN